MRKIDIIKNDLSASIAEAKMVEGAEAQEKALGRMGELQKELENAMKVEAAERALAEERFGKEVSKGRDFSLIKFIRESVEGNLTGFEKEVAEEGRAEHQRLGLPVQGRVIPTFVIGQRAAAGQNYGTNADGGYMIETMEAKYLEALRAKLVLADMGASVLTGLVGTLPLISASDITAGWAAEAATTSVTKSTIGRLTMTPHRNSAAVAFTKDLLRQTSHSVDDMLMEKLMNAHAQILETGAISGSGSSNQPTGILSNTGIGSVAMGTNGGNITWAAVVGLESAVDNANALQGKLGYLTNAKVLGNMKTIQKASGFPAFIVDDKNPNVVNGHKINWTSNVPANLTKGSSSQVCSAMIFGNWEDLYIGSWGGLDLVVDPYTLAANAEVRIIMNAWNDAVVARPASFAAIKDITIA